MGGDGYGKWSVAVAVLEFDWVGTHRSRTGVGWHHDFALAPDEEALWQQALEGVPQGGWQAWSHP
ncbi:MAG: hypothetical protein IMHGJWDQ_001810 [Candidatus Fervidibacter sp.]